MRIDKKLNLVTTVLNDDDTKVFIHSTPISTDIYEIYWKVLDKVFNDIHTQGRFMTGARQAYRFLKEASDEASIWNNVQKGLIAEIHRLTNVVVMGEKGWDTMPFDDAVSAKLLDAEAAKEVDAKLVFFTLSYHGYIREMRKELLSQALSLWNAEIVSLDFTAWENSLKTLTTQESSGENKPS